MGTHFDLCSECHSRGFNYVLRNICSYTITVGSGYEVLQWNLFIQDALGPANLSTVERLSTLQR